MQDATIRLDQLLMLAVSSSLNAIHATSPSKPISYNFSWLTDLAFKLPESVRQIPLLRMDHPQDGSYYWLSYGYYPDDDPLQYALVGDRNEACLNACRLLVEAAKVYREEKTEKPDRACYIVKSFSEIDTFAVTDIIYLDESGKEEIIASFDTAIQLPPDIIEHFKIDDTSKLFPSDYDENYPNDKGRGDVSLSGFFARYTSVNDGTKPIVIPLRNDGTSLPVVLYDYTMALGPGKKGVSKQKGHKKRSVDTDL